MKAITPTDDESGWINITCPRCAAEPGQECYRTKHRKTLGRVRFSIPAHQSRKVMATAMQATELIGD